MQKIDLDFGVVIFNCLFCNDILGTISSFKGERGIWQNIIYVVHTFLHDFRLKMPDKKSMLI